MLTPKSTASVRVRLCDVLLVRPKLANVLI
jgi:hypothetical protein